jgi:integrase
VGRLTGAAGGERIRADTRSERGRQPGRSIRKDDATRPTEGGYMPIPGISERRDRSGRVRYQVRVRRAGRYQTATFPKLAEAVAWRDEALAAAEGLADPPAPPARTGPRPLPARAVTVADAARRLARGMVDGSIRARDGRPYKPSVVRKYEEALRCLILPRAGAVPIATLTAGDVQRLVDAIAAERTAEHARKALTALRVTLRVAERYGELVANPCAGVRVPASAEGEKPPRILTPEEAARIIAAAEAEDARRARSFAAPLIALAFGSGARLGELLALPWGPDGLELDAGILRVRRSVDRVRDPATGLYPFVPPKSKASARDVPLAADDAARMRRHRLASGRPPDGALVFGNEEGEALSPLPAGRAFRRAAIAAGLDEPLPRLHDARHAFASHALAAGLSAHAVAALLGHTDAALVWRRYGHALPDELAGAGAALAAFRQARGVMT